MRDKKFLFGSEQAEKSVLYTALKSTTTYGIFRFSLRLENRMVTLKQKYKISIGMSNRNIYKNWRIFVKFGPRSPVQPERCLLINCMSVAVFQIIQPLDVLILVVGVDVDGVAAFSQVHQNPGGILQTAKIGHVIPVIVGQHDGAEVFQRNMVLQPR